MRPAPVTTAHVLLRRVLPLALAAVMAPLLMAPTCGGFAPGVKTFSRNSLIIPMDVCYQCTTDGDNNVGPASCGVSAYATPTGNGFTGGKVCPQATDAGDVVKAYGLVYQLIRAGVPVYWVIRPDKTKLDDYDLTIHYGGGAPVLLYDWAAEGPGAPPTATADGDINYMGGLFVVDGTDFTEARKVLTGNVDPTCTTITCETNRTRFGAVNVHVANVAFQAPVARTMAGGWNAGGTVPPKLALLDIGSAYADGSQAKNSEIVIRGYLQRAGLDFGNAGGEADGVHGQIYDRLDYDDFLPDASGDWKTTRLYQNGYQILWVPHWAAPGSCTNVSSCSSTQISDADVSRILETIGAFVSDATDVDPGSAYVPAGLNDLFAECAGLGSFDGVPNNNTYSPSWLLTAQEHTHFQTDATPGPAGFGITTTTPGAAMFWGSFASPLMQIGDFQFRGVSGAIATYKASDYQTGVVRLISESADSGKDIFTIRPAEISSPAAPGDHGTIVYMGGHSYSGTDGTYQTAGTRLVLNSLFNLGASCVATGVQCNTGALGVCGIGTMQCSPSGAMICLPSVAPGALPEICNGLDDDCDGLVDEDLARDCYTGPPGTEDVGLCHGGTQYCVRRDNGTYGFGDCVGERKPSDGVEVCDGFNNDCDVDDSGNELVDEDLTQKCYTGPTSSIDPASGGPMGICQRGEQVCADGVWLPCPTSDTPYAPDPGEQVLPQARECLNDGDGNQVDDNCNGLVDEGCGCDPAITPSQPCYSGPVGTMDNRPCSSGTQACVDGSWSTCTGQVLPVAEICGNGLDDDCDGVQDGVEAVCNTCLTERCYDGPAGTAGDPANPDDVRECREGVRACTDGAYGECLDQILPSIELCDGKDNDCDGHVDGDLDDDGVYDAGEVRPPCGDGRKCENGLCVKALCGSENYCPPGYECTGGTCVPFACPSAICDPGQYCDSGTMACIDPCKDSVCGPGTFCSGGVCVGGACYTAGCPAGQVCRDGACTVDPCATTSCPSGTFCRDGDCVQACAYVDCVEGSICGDDGFCTFDPCLSMSCGAGNTCVSGQCVPNLCTAIDCGNEELKVCRQYLGPSGWTATCFDNPCNAVSCPTGTCLPREARDCTTEPCIRAQCFAATNPGGAGTVPPLETTESCGCASGAPSPATALLGLLLLPLARRRRPRGGAGLAALAVAAGLALGPAGCTKEETTGTDPADCVEACNVDALVAPYVEAITPSSGLKGSPATVAVELRGARFAPGASIRVFPAGELAVRSVAVDGTDRITAVLDLASAEQGAYLLRVVNPDKVISNLAPFDAVYMRPLLAAVDPVSIPIGVTVLDVTGSGFTAASSCRVRSGSYTLSLPTSLASSEPPGTRLSCTLDSATVAPGTVYLSVVNEGGLESEAKLPVAVEGPFALSAMSPPAVAATCHNPPACDQVAVHVVLALYGSGFDSGCTVLADTAATPTTSRPTLFIDPTRLQATLDLVGIPKANLPLVLRVAVEKGAETTPALDLAVVETTVASQVDTLEPQSAYQGSTGVALALRGISLPSDSVVQILPPAGPNAGVWQALPSSGGDTVVTGTLDLGSATDWPAGEYQVRLQYPSAGSYSVTFPFRVVSNVPVLWKVTPGGGQQGATVVVTVEGTTFFSGATLALQGPGGFTRSPTGATTFTADPPGSTSGTLSASFSLASMDTGAFSVVAKNSASGASSPLTFSVTPGQPTLASLTPPSASQSTATLVTVTLAGTNFAKPDPSGVGGSMVFIRNEGLGIDTMTLPPGDVTVVDHDTLTLSLDTREAIPSAGCASPYKVKVVNPGATLMETVERDFCLTP